MTYRMPPKWIAIAGGATAYSTLLNNHNGLAHTGHAHTTGAEPDGPTNATEPSTPTVESTTDESLAPTSEAHEIDVITMPSAEAEETGSNGSTSEVLPMSQESAPTPVSQAGLSDGFSISLGEPLLGLIIAGPFLLNALRRRVQS
ncbi:MAG: hypothetical protein AAF215_22690 [Cyanobacteria bacterium P01_A01_bin.123]